MNGKVLLDTNIVIALFADERFVKQRIASTEEIFIPSIVLGELYYGARKSIHFDQNSARIDELATNSAVLLCDIATAQHYGEIKAQLRTKGKPIPENDIWIAAIGKQHQLTIATRDNHFQYVDDLVIEQW
jgi:tRNA(fMet)-specific endonuclease VapC